MSVLLTYQHLLLLVVPACSSSGTFFCGPHQQYITPTCTIKEDDGEEIELNCKSGIAESELIRGLIEFTFDH